jgi:hypothetical protein
MQCQLRRIRIRRRRRRKEEDDDDDDGDDDSKLGVGHDAVIRNLWCDLHKRSLPFL